MDIMEPISYSYGEYFEKVIFLLENPFERMKLEEQIKERNHLLFNDKDSIIEWQNMLIDLHKKHNDPTFRYQNLIKMTRLFMEYI